MMVRDTAHTGPRPCIRSHFRAEQARFVADQRMAVPGSSPGVDMFDPILMHKVPHRQQKEVTFRPRCNIVGASTTEYGDLQATIIYRITVQLLVPLMTWPTYLPTYLGNLGNSLTAKFGFII